MVFFVIRVRRFREIHDLFRIHVVHARSRIAAACAIAGAAPGKEAP
jgi:hypothetical protein